MDLNLVNVLQTHFVLAVNSLQIELPHTVLLNAEICERLSQVWAA